MVSPPNQQQSLSQQSPHSQLFPLRQHTRCRHGRAAAALASISKQHPRGTAGSSGFPWSPEWCMAATWRVQKDGCSSGSKSAMAAVWRVASPPVLHPRPPGPRRPHTHFTQRWKPPWPVLLLDPWTAVILLNTGGGNNKLTPLPREAILLLFTNQLCQQVRLAGRASGSSDFFLQYTTPSCN